MKLNFIALAVFIALLLTGLIFVVLVESIDEAPVMMAERQDQNIDLSLTNINHNQAKNQQIYTNDKFGYSFNFPNGFIAEKGILDNRGSESKYILDSTKIILSNGNSSDIPVEVSVWSKNERMAALNGENIAVAGIPAVKIIEGPTESFSGDSETIYLFRNGFYYVLSWNSLNDKSLFDTIVSSFKFTK